MRGAFTIAGLLVAAGTPPGYAQMRDADPVGLTLTFKKGGSPLDKSNVSLDIKNNGAKAIELRTELPFGIKTLLDVALLDDKGVRLTTEFYRKALSSPTGESTLWATIPVGESIRQTIELADGIPDGKLKSGKYTCRIRFKYDPLKIDVKTVEVEVVIGKSDIENYKK